MTSINSSDSIGISHRSSRVDNSGSSTSKSKVAVTTNQSLSSLTDISKLADEAARSGEDIRPEAIDRAQKLLQDPSWLSDYNIDGLAGKLIDIENI